MAAVDVILVLTLICCTVAGYRKGLMGALCSLLIIVVSFLGAFLAVQLFSARVETAIEPHVEKFLEERITMQVEDRVQEIEDATEEIGISIGGISYTLGDLIELLGSFGLDVETQAAEAVSDSTGAIIRAYAQGVAEAICAPLARTLVFAGAFLILYLLLHTFELLFASGSRLPTVRLLNHAGGGVVGFLTAAVLLTAVVTALTQNGVLSEETTGGVVFGLVRSVSALIL